MLVKKYLQASSNLFAENRLLKFVVVVLAVAVVYSSVAVHYAINKQKTIVIPVNLERQIEVSGNEVDNNYITEFVYKIMNLGLNYTPATARGQFDKLLSMYAPEDFGRAKEKWYELASTVEFTKGVSSVFYIQKIGVLPDKNIEVTGIRKVYSDNTKTEDEVKTYVVKYDVRMGRFMIKDFYEKGAGKPDSHERER